MDLVSIPRKGLARYPFWFKYRTRNLYSGSLDPKALSQMQPANHTAVIEPDIGPKFGGLMDTGRMASDVVARNSVALMTRGNCNPIRNWRIGNRSLILLTTPKRSRVTFRRTHALHRA